MAYGIYDRVLESTTTTGTGTLVLSGAVTGFQSFAAVGTGNTCPYSVWGVDANGVPSGEWETGIGTYTASGTTLARTKVTASSNGGALVSFSAGTKRVALALGSNALLTHDDVCNGRLTTETGVPVSTSDRTAQGTIYFTPYLGNRVALYNGSSWQVYSFAQLSYAVVSVAGAVSNLNLWDSAGTLTLEADYWLNSTVTITIATPGVVTWTAHGLSNGDSIVLSTTGALPTGLTAGTTYYLVNKAADTFQLAATVGGTAINTSGTQSGVHTAYVVGVGTGNTTDPRNLTLQDGILCKTGSLTRRNIGVFRASAANVTADSGGNAGTTQVGGQRYLWNRYNQVPRNLKVIDTTDLWGYTSATIRQANGATGNKVEYVTGDVASLVTSEAIHSGYTQSATTYASTGVGVDSTSTYSGVSSSGGSQFAGAYVVLALFGRYSGHPGLGYHYLSWNEAGQGTLGGFYGDNGGVIQSGLSAWLKG